MENDNRSSGMIGKKQNMSKKMSACDREKAVRTGMQGKRASAVWMQGFIWQGLHFTCGRNPVSPEQKVPERDSFPGAGCAAVSVRIMILLSGAEDGL